MTYAYDQTLVYKAQISMARMLDYAVNDYGMKLELFYGAFLNSGYAKAFENGDSHVIAGMSGTELAFRILEDIIPGFEPVRPAMRIERTQEYWMGYNLAYYQWYRNVAYERITQNLAIENILALYDKYHEMDVRQFVEQIDRMRQEACKDRQLKRLRRYAQFSQKQLAESSGVPVRTIQQYEQGQKDINRAAFETVMAIARTLKCRPEKL